MRAVVQRVTSASVTVNNTVISRIGRGMLVLVGIAVDDTPSDSEYLVKKILGLKLFDGLPHLSESSSVEAGQEETEDPEGAGGRMWKRSVVDIEGDILCGPSLPIQFSSSPTSPNWCSSPTDTHPVSQFTLLASTTKGYKPDFHSAMPPSHSHTFYHTFLTSLRAAYVPEKVGDGQFGAKMLVGGENDGPVTVVLDSRKWEYVDRPQGRGKGKGSASGSGSPAEKSKSKGMSGARTPISASTPAEGETDLSSLSPDDNTVPRNPTSERRTTSSPGLVA
ncbi:hypothetical protein DACRYDRAFT_108765 [Dacryopinax primogenitus]|uniref:D-aminoacyl-tRNA deacylase n=1 Tax=Dacryopinax primogenitus (strain DJM 731) TaxID=1858805 RepID=M5GA28_DACPD|nr:uncharacterized protein DACRYDRAFT_108765 [Dacryopinax primogenitus]EJU00698.1 hypothetical protein DACRYDRAFT_108765 [Dacryopinax primogenitus]